MKDQILAIKDSVQIRKHCSNRNQEQLVKQDLKPYQVFMHQESETREQMVRNDRCPLSV